MRHWITLCEKVAAPARIRRKSAIPPPITPEFRRWFSSSKVVDRKGQPLVCYHGTHNAIEAFDAAHGPTGLIFFSANPEMANGYASGVMDDAGANIVPVYLRIIQPYDYRRANNKRIASEFYAYNGAVTEDDARMIRVALYGDEKIEDDDNPRVTSGPLSVEEFATALNQGHYPALEQFDFLEFLKGRNFDGIITYEVKSINFGIFEGSQAKSVFAKEFNFDSDDLSESYSIRRWMLCEQVVPDGTLQKAAKRLVQNIDWSEGSVGVFVGMGYDYDDASDVDQNSPEFQAKLLDWAVGQVDEAQWKIHEHFNGDVIRVYRMITAPPDWKPDPKRHPGDYWAWEEDCAKAHWGEFGNGNVEWMMTADVKASQIDWIQTLAVNGNPDSEDECEIALIPNTPVTLLSYKRVK